MEAAGYPWDVWGEIPAEKVMNSGFPGCYHSACPRVSRRTVSPGKIKHPLSFEGREVTAGVTRSAPISSCSPLAFRIQLFLQRKERHCCKVAQTHSEHIRAKLDQRSSWKRRRIHCLGSFTSPYLAYAQQSLLPLPNNISACHKHWACWSTASSPADLSFLY